MEAITWLADRAFGKPTQKLEGEIRAPLSIIHRTPDYERLAKKPDEERVRNPRCSRASAARRSRAGSPSGPAPARACGE
jgi:hypothetical protein